MRYCNHIKTFQNLAKLSCIGCVPSHDQQSLLYKNRENIVHIYVLAFDQNPFLAPEVWIFSSLFLIIYWTWPTLKLWAFYVLAYFLVFVSPFAQGVGDIFIANTNDFLGFIYPESLSKSSLCRTGFCLWGSKFFA